jgi:hypothetical protein
MGLGVAPLPGVRIRGETCPDRIRFDVFGGGKKIRLIHRVINDSYNSREL